MTATTALLVSAALLSLAAGEISDYDNYLEDKSLIGKEIACTEEEKECFRFERVLYTDGKCYMLSHVGPCNDSEFHFVKEKARNGEYKAECQPTWLCGTPNKMFMAYDQTCYATSLANQVCDYKKNLSYSQNFFGEGQCRCFGDSCPPRPVVTQPEEAGKCRLPDLIKTSFLYWADPLAYRSIPCTEREHECFLAKQVLHEESGRCYPPLERGPCPEGQLLAPDVAVFNETGRLQAVCAPPLCPEGQQRMQTDRRCYGERDILQKMCPPNIYVRDVFGYVGCGFEQDVDVGGQLPQERRPEGMCIGRYRRFR